MKHRVALLLSSFFALNISLIYADIMVKPNKYIDFSFILGEQELFLDNWFPIRTRNASKLSFLVYPPEPECEIGYTIMYDNCQIGLLYSKDTLRFDFYQGEKVRDYKKRIIFMTNRISGPIQIATQDLNPKIIDLLYMVDNNPLFEKDSQVKHAGTNLNCSLIGTKSGDEFPAFPYQFNFRIKKYKDRETLIQKECEPHIIFEKGYQVGDFSELTTRSPFQVTDDPYGYDGYDLQRSNLGKKEESNFIRNLMFVAFGSVFLFVIIVIAALIIFNNKKKRRGKSSRNKDGTDVATDVSAISAISQASAISIY